MKRPSDFGFVGGDRGLMGNSDSWKPGSRPGGNPPPATRAADPKPAPTAEDASKGKAAGRVIHDERGNAVWDWVKDTTRIAIDSTTRLLKRLEVPELKVEDTQEQELRIESDRDSGGGYDPYGGSGATSSRPAGDSSNRGHDGRGERPGSSKGPTNAPPPRGGPGSLGNVGGGYDPYGKSVTNHPTRKR